MKGYKAFNKDMTCRGFKYEEGKEYEIDGELNICNNRLHFCENPFAVLRYYDISSSIFGEIEAVGKTITEGDKSCTSKIKIIKILSLHDFNMACHEYINKKIIPQAGYNSRQSQAGEGSRQSQAGDYSRQSQAGDYSRQEILGKNSIAMACGNNCMIKGIKGSVFALTEWINNKPFIKCGKIDGKKLKENVWYTLKNKKFIEVK